MVEGSSELFEYTIDAAANLYNSGNWEMIAENATAAANYTQEYFESVGINDTIGYMIGEGESLLNQTANQFNNIVEWLT